MTRKSPRRHDDLLPLDEAQRRLSIVGQSYVGVHAIEVDRVVGSLDRSQDFDRDFLPRLPGSRLRIAQLREAFPQGDAPPIEAYEIGGVYFVSDGHHRVAWAKQRSAQYIDAEVTHLATNVALGPDVDVCQLVHTDAQATLLRESGIAEARPDAVIEFSRPGGYPELLELVKAHGYDLMRERGALLDRAEVGADWYDGVYVPGVEALRRESLADRYRYKTDADLFLWVYQRRRALRLVTNDADFDAAARDAGGRRVSRRFRREFMREKSHPLQVISPEER